MAKTAPLKKKATSLHSRAAKRASSPSIDTDKSLKNVQLPSETKSRPSILAVHQSAGVTKKNKHGRKSVLSAKAKKRQERGMDRAESIMDKSETKIEKSKGRARNVQDRAKAWEDMNKAALIAKKESEDALEKEKLEVDFLLDVMADNNARADDPLNAADPEKSMEEDDEIL